MEEKICPFVMSPVPGKTVGTIQLVRPPCAKEKCALWMPFANLCIFVFIAYLMRASEPEERGGD
jgi:hypothetical protein